MSDPNPPDTRATSIIEKIARWLGVALMVVVGWMYLVSGLVAPMWAVIALLVVWGVIFGFAIKVWARHPWWVLAAPLVALAVWFVTLWVGGEFLGWTA